MKKRTEFQTDTGSAASGRHPAVIYARVSSKDQEKEGYSIPAQLELLRGYAGAHGFDVLKEFTDVETAKAAGRTSFGEMIALLCEGPVDRLAHRTFHSTCDLELASSG